MRFSRGSLCSYREAAKWRHLPATGEQRRRVLFRITTEFFETELGHQLLQCGQVALTRTRHTILQLLRTTGWGRVTGSKHWTVFR